MCHHEVVHRGPHIRIPLLRQRRMSLLDLIAIARHIVVIQHGVEQLALVVLYQHREEVTIAYVACCQTRSVGLNIVDKMLKHSLIVAIGNHLEV